MSEKILLYDNESIIVNTPILELYLPEEYSKTGLYYMDGEASKVFAIGNFRVFNKESEISTRDSKDTYPLCIAAFILTKPREVDIDEVSLYANSKKKRCIILRYFKNDIFIVNRNIIKSIDNMTILTNLLESGKLDCLPYDVISDTIIKAQEIDNISLRLPEEDIDAIVSERFRDPKNPTKKARFIKGYPREVISVNPREEANMNSTFAAFNFEDINTALVVCDNRKTEGIVEPENKMEKIVKGEKIE